MRLAVRRSYAICDVRSDLSTLHAVVSSIKNRSTAMLVSLAASVAFTPPCSRSLGLHSTAAPLRRATPARMESEMEYRKRLADEKGEQGGGWSIFAPKPGEEKPDPPWLVDAKKRAEARAARAKDANLSPFQTSYDVPDPDAPPPEPKAEPTGFWQKIMGGYQEKRAAAIKRAEAPEPESPPADEAEGSD